MNLAALVGDKLRNNIYTCRNGMAAGFKRKGGLGFLPRSAPDTAEVTFLKTLEFHDKVVYDIGGYHGLMTIFFAKTASQVITYEANPENVMRIYDNARLNGFEVIVRNVAISDEDGMITLSMDPEMTGAASGDPQIAKSLSKNGQPIRRFSVAMTTIDNDVRRTGLPKPDFIKIDIEGMELRALIGMRNTLLESHPDLFVELHGTTHEHWKENKDAVSDFIKNCDYEINSVGGQHLHCKARIRST